MSAVSTIAKHNLRFNRVPDDTSYLGTRVTVPIHEYTSGSDAAFRLGAMVEAVFVVNKSGGTLKPGARVTWHNDPTLYVPGAAVGGVAGATGHGAGFASPFIREATVANNNGFWAIVKGLTKVLYDGTSELDTGDEIEAAASGRVAPHYTGLFLGFAAEDIDSASDADTLMWAFIDNT